MEARRILFFGLTLLVGCTDDSATRQTISKPKTWGCSWQQPARSITITELQATPLHEAAQQLNIKAVRRLLNSATVNSRDGMQRTPLFHVVYDSIPEAKELGMAGDTIAASEYAEKKKKKGAKKIQIANLLIMAGANVDAQDNRGRTPLMVAMNSYGRLEPYRIEILEILIKNTSQPNLQDIDGNTAIMSAITNADAKAIASLRMKGADPGIRRCDGKSAIELAHSSNNPALIAALQ